MDKQEQIKQLENSIESRMALLGQHVRIGDRVMSFMAFDEKLRTDPALARTFEALQKERSELERLRGIGTQAPQDLDVWDDWDETMYMSDEEIAEAKKIPGFLLSDKYPQHYDGIVLSADDYPAEWFEEKKTISQRRAVLTALVEMGGEACDTDVVQRYEQIMRSQLQPVDYVPVESNPNEPAWEARCRYTRKDLILLGWMEDDTPRKRWAITPLGRQQLLLNDLDEPVKLPKGYE
jgi:hypothetical protein